jgi:hypothetical protein
MVISIASVVPLLKSAKALVVMLSYSQISEGVRVVARYYAVLAGIRFLRALSDF